MGGRGSKSAREQGAAPVRPTIDRYDYRVSPDGMSDKFYKTEEGARRAAERYRKREVATSRRDRTGATVYRPRRVVIYRDGWSNEHGLVEHTEIGRIG